MDADSYFYFCTEADQVAEFIFKPAQLALSCYLHSN